MSHIKEQFAKLEFISFESLSKEFMLFASDRYPSTERALRIPGKLGLKEDDLGAKIALMSILREAVHEVDPLRIFQSYAHRDEILKAIIDASDELEEDFEANAKEITDDIFAIADDKNTKSSKNNDLKEYFQNLKEGE